MYKLYKIKVETDDDNIYQFSPDGDSVTYGGQKYAVKANADLLKRFLRRAGSADELTSPRSKRGMTYDSIIQNILNGTDNNIYIFAHKYPSSLDDLKRMMQ